jgi:hypothetical protein
VCDAWALVGIDVADAQQQEREQERVRVPTPAGIAWRCMVVKIAAGCLPGRSASAACATLFTRQDLYH